MFLPYGDNVDRKTFPVLPLFLIITNVALLLHVESIIHNDNEQFEATIAFHKNFALTPTEFADGNILGILSYMFLHADFMHLIGNMIVLWAFALSLEALMGRLAFSVCFVGWGVAGGLAHLGMNWGSEVPLVGASGAIAGLIGAYTVAFGPMARIKCLMFFGFFFFKVRIPAMIFGGGWILMQLLEATSVSNAGSNVAWYCHIGGFVAGAATMAFFRSEVRDKVKVYGSGTVEIGEAGEESPDVVVDNQGPMGEAFVAQQIAAMQAEAEIMAQGGNQTCQYCQSELSDEHFLAQNMARCPNSECGSLNYLNRDQPTFS